MLAAALFWIVALALISGAGLWASRPLWASRGAAPSRAAHDVQVYKSQLAELERDAARGALSEAEAEGGRREIARRLLAADAAAETEGAYEASPRPRARLALMLALGPVLVAAIGLYLLIGRPGLPDHPLAERDLAAERHAAEEARRATQLTQAAAEAAYAARRGESAAAPEPDAQTKELIERMETVLAQRPTDPRGRILLGRAYMSLDRPEKAWPLYREALRLGGAEQEPSLPAALGEAMMLAAGGYVSREAEDAFRSVPQMAISQYLIGAAEAQRGEFEIAFRRWVTLYRDQSDAPFAAQLHAQIRRAAEMLGPDAQRVAEALPAPGVSPGGAEAGEATASAGEGAPDQAAPDAPGPNAGQIRDAAAMSAEDRQAMIEGMVSGLAARLDEDPNDLPGWLRLIRAYAVMNRAEEAQAALDTARKAFAEDEAALAQLEQAASAAGLSAQ